MSDDFTPQEKKRKSLESDCRNCYGENDKSSRKAIRRRKEIVNRTFRRTVKQALTENTADAEVLGDHVGRIERIDWRKVPDKPLGEYLLRKLTSEIVSRITDAPDREAMLAILEAHLTNTEIAPLSVQDIMRQLHHAIGSRSRTLQIDSNVAHAIVDFLNRHAMK